MRLLTALDATPTTPGLRRVSLVVDDGRICGAWRWTTYYSDWRQARIMLPLDAADGVPDGEAEAAEMERLLYPLVYRWRNNEVRARLYGRRCRIIARGAMNTVRLEFADNLETITTSGNALRKAKEGD